MPWLEAFLGRRCPVCGGPLDAVGVCRACREALVPERVGGAVYLARYPRVRGLVRAAKYRAHRRAALWAGERLADRVAQTGWPIEAVACVPTLPWRAALRGGHLPAVLAGGLARRLGRPLYRGLVRTAYTPSQTRRAQRRRLPQVFAARGRPPAGVLLVDDVLTTGATFARAAEALLEAGASTVWGAFLAVAEPDRLRRLPYRKV